MVSSQRVSNDRLMTTVVMNFDDCCYRTVNIIFSYYIDSQTATSIQVLYNR